MATYEIKNATSTHNINNLDKTIFDRDYSKENNIPNDNKIVQYYNLKDIKHDISSQFIILKNTDREVCPELRVKLLDNLNYSRNTLDNLRVTLTNLQLHPVNQAVLQSRPLLKYLNLISLIC